MMPHFGLVDIATVLAIMAGLAIVLGMIPWILAQAVEYVKQHLDQRNAVDAKRDN